MTDQPDASCSACACLRRAARRRCQLDGLAERLALLLLHTARLLEMSGILIAPTATPWHACFASQDTATECPCDQCYLGDCAGHVSACSIQVGRWEADAVYGTYQRTANWLQVMYRPARWGQGSRECTPPGRAALASSHHLQLMAWLRPPQLSRLPSWPPGPSSLF